MTKRLSAKVTINVNIGSLKLNVKGTKPSTEANGLIKSDYANGAVGEKMWLKGSDIQFPNGTCPLMVGPAGVALNVFGTKATISCSIKQPNATVGAVSHSTLGVPAHTLPSCRIYMPVVDRCSEKKDEYIADNRSKLMKWDDYFYTQL
jgi:hypothetical protein